jgi:hypothetical protein
MPPIRTRILRQHSRHAEAAQGCPGGNPVASSSQHGGNTEANIQGHPTPGNTAEAIENQ